MKSLLAAGLLFISYSSHSQNYLDVIGRTYKELNEIPEFRNCIRLDARINNCSQICRELQDTINFKIIIVAEQEITRTNYEEFLITDIVVIDSIKSNNFILIGSYETKKGRKTSAFVIAVEQDREDNKPNAEGTLAAIPDKSIKIFQAWTFSCATKRFEMISLRGLYRINEGYYYI